MLRHLQELPGSRLNGACRGPSLDRLRAFWTCSGAGSISTERLTGAANLAPPVR